MKTSLAPSASLDEWLAHPGPEHDPERNPMIRAVHVAVWLVGYDAAEKILAAISDSPDGYKGSRNIKVAGLAAADGSTPLWAGEWIGLRDIDGVPHIALRDRVDRVALLVPIDEANDVAVFIGPDRS